MNERLLDEVCDRYALGNPAGPPARVFGGLLHHTYRVQAAQGEFAVKILSPTVMRHPDVRASFRRSERIAVAVRVAGLPAVAALESAGDVIHDFGQVTVMVYPWIPGETLSTGAAGPDCAQRVGRILGRIHALPLHSAGLHPPGLQGFSANDEDDWESLVSQAEDRTLPWAMHVRPLLADIAAWRHQAAEAKQALQDRWVVSHGDLDQKNVLWTDEQTPWLIDWEAAGLVQPAIEAVGAALVWGGQVTGNLDIGTFYAFLREYCQESALNGREVNYGIRAYCGDWCGWLKFNMQRSLGLGTSDLEEQALGAREIFSTLALLRSARSSLPALAEGFDSGSACPS